jgi:hypothetical protein
VLAVEAAGEAGGPAHSATATSKSAASDVRV